MIKEIDEKEISVIVDGLKQIKGVDFRHYAPSSLKRRMQRFMEVRKIWEVETLMRLTEENNEFAQDFLDEITVCVTEMFRNPSFWRIMNDRIMPILNASPTIRIWHAACSSGEEVLSMAILLEQAGLLKRSVILGTDINLRALEMARSGRIPLRRLREYEGNYNQMHLEIPLSEYYSIVGDDAVFHDTLLERTEYEKHDLASAISPGTFDIILGRNVFIYFNRVLQDRVLAMFHESLSNHGFLVLGNRESISACRAAANFHPYMIEEKIFQKKGIKL